tara:strand:- start:110 stop:502 length:393 start_codon:yes stop_codon:yes gene_type:complete
MKTMKFNSTNATHLLLFLETCVNTDVHNVPLEFTLEHIYCQNNKEKLRNPTLINNIGNLTLYEGKNSENGHKGNSSLGSKSYHQKKQSYKGSSCMITREIANKYDTDFTEEDIINRNYDIISLLNRYTDY